MYKSLSIFFFLLTSVFYAQAPNVVWMRRFGGLSSDLMSSLIKTQDGGFLLGGYSNSGITGVKTEDRIGFTPDYWVVKTDASGVIEWQKTIGGGMPVFFGDLEAEVLREIRQSSDGGYFLGGNSDSPVFGSKTEPNYGMQDYWIVKINNVGDIVWQKDIGGSDYDECFALETTPDGGCIVGGYSKSGISGNKTEPNRGLKDYWVVKLDMNGQIEWQKTYGGSSDDILYSIAVLDNQEYLLNGMSASNVSGDKTENSKGGGDFWFIKIDGVGNIIWQKTIGGDNADEPSNMVKLDDGFMIGGYSRSNISFDKSENSLGGADYWVVKTDFSGNVLWDKTYGGDLDDYLRKFILLQNNSGFVLAGSSYSGISGNKTEANFGDYNGWVVRIHQNGDLLWQKAIGGSYIDGLNQVVQLQDQTILLGGVANSGVSGNLTVPGYGGNDYWLVKLDMEQLDVSNISTDRFLIFPNPTAENLNVRFSKEEENLEVSIYNSLMQLVDVFRFKNELMITVPINHASGFYFINMTNDRGEVFKAKVVKE